jgi:hypothetical protein
MEISREQMHNLRKLINDTFYISLENLERDQRQAFVKALELIDSHLQSSNDDIFNETEGRN